MSQLARAATNDEKTMLRTPGDWSRVYIGISVPNVISPARLNGAPASNDMVGEISFDGGSGTLANVRSEMTLWVGSVAGGRDLGVCRIRKSAIAGTFYIGYTSDVAWADNCYLTVVDFAMLDKRPRLVADGVTLMDGEHEFDDQHIDFDPVPVVSPHAVAWLTGADVDVDFDASDSWVFDSTISGYQWTAPGSVSIDDNTSATPVITYDTAGHYAVYCNVTAANGKSFRATRYVMIFDANHPPHKGEVSEPGASYDAGGWEFGVRLFDGVDLDAGVDGALCIAFSEDWYGSTKQSVGPVEARENIICWGYIDGESIDWDAEAGSVEFSVSGPHAWLGKIEINPVELSMATNTPDAWDVMPDLTVDRALWHVLHWRTNATALLSFLPSDDARYAPNIKTSSGAVWEILKEIAWKKIFGRVGCDRYGRLWAVVDPQCVPEADRDWATVMTLTKKDWKERIGVTRNTTRKLAILSTSGWIVDASGQANTVYSLAMGHIAGKHGGSEIIDQLLVTDQAGANELAGLYAGWKNVELEFELTLAQNNRMVDLWPNQFLAIDMATTDNVRGLEYNGNLVPRSISLPFDAEAGCFETVIRCEAETFAELAVDGDVPEDTGWDGTDLDVFDDNFDFDFDGDLIITPPDELNPNQPKVVVMATDQGVIYTEDFDADSPTWKFMNNGLSEAERENIGQLVVTPSGAIYITTDTPTVWDHGWNKVMVADGVGGTWRTLLTGDDFPIADSIILGIGKNQFSSDSIAAWGGRPSTAGDTESHKGYLATGNRGGMTVHSASSVDIIARWAALFRNNTGSWTVLSSLTTTNNAYVFKVSDSGSVIGSTVAITDASAGAMLGGVPCGSKDQYFQWDFETLNGFVKFTGGSQTRITDFSPGNLQGMAFSPTGNFGLGSDWFSLIPYKSDDGGDTWEAVSDIIAVGSDVWENCGDDNRWIFGGGTTIKLTMDCGVTAPIDKSGNLAWIAPLVDIGAIRFIS